MSYPIYPDRSFDYDLDRALAFMAKTIDACGHNPKPLVLHCPRVGMALYAFYSRAIVLAGVLHDLTETRRCRRSILRKSSATRRLAWSKRIRSTCPSPTSLSGRVRCTTIYDKELLWQRSPTDSRAT